MKNKDQKINAPQELNEDVIEDINGGIDLVTQPDQYPQDNVPVGAIMEA